MKKSKTDLQGDTKVGEQKIKSAPSRQNILSVSIGVMLVVVLFALFSGNGTDDMQADLHISGSMQKGVFVNNDWADIDVSAVNSYVVKKYTISPKTKGVVIVERDGNRDVLMKLREGDVITGINNMKINDLRDFRKASQYINPTEGMFLEIQRDGLPMFVSISGSNPAMGKYPVDSRDSDPFFLKEIAPFLGRDISMGGLNFDSGPFGKEIQKWVESNFGSGFYACRRCGTVIPQHAASNYGTITCPNCGAQMVLK